MSKIANVLKKDGKLVIGIVGLAAVIAWSGGFFAKKVKPGVLENQSGVAVPAPPVAFRERDMPYTGQLSPASHVP